MKVSTNLEIKRTYTVGGVEYDSKEEAKQAFANEVLDSVVAGGKEEMIKNAKEVISALRILSKV